MTSQSLTYRKLVVSGEARKSTYFLLGLMPVDFDMSYFAKSKGYEPIAEWDERFIPYRDRELVKANQIFYLERVVTGGVATVKQLHGVPEKDLSQLYGHVVPESKTRKRVRTRNVEEPKPRVRNRTRTRKPV